MLTIEAPAKINWSLRVLGLRDDGYHEIQTVLQKITLTDSLTFVPSDELRVHCDLDIPPEDNLVFRAASMVRDECRVRKGVNINLVKRIPAGAGLGGGSSDAAATLIVLNDLWSLGLSETELARFAGKIGSDVPFFLGSALSAAGGRGEKLTPLGAGRTVDILLVKPPRDLSTAVIYDEYGVFLRGPAARSADELLSGPEGSRELTKKVNKVDNIPHLISMIEEADFSGLSNAVVNDLEPVALRHIPEIAEIKRRLRGEGALFSLMSGSGSAVFGVFDSRRKAEEASLAFPGFWTAVARTVSG